MPQNKYTSSCLCQMRHKAKHKFEKALHIILKMRENSFPTRYKLLLCLHSHTSRQMWLFQIGNFSAVIVYKEALFSVHENLNKRLKVQS